jgi:RNA polymerase sigma factor (sigma-70 family)
VSVSRCVPWNILFGISPRRVFNNELKMTDSQILLVDYVQSGSEAAFRELVTRYLGLVYSAALRLVAGDTHRAQDVAQTVFVDLARTARTLSRDVMLGGWLHRHTCFVAANTLRSERRRQSRERQAVEMNALHDHSESGLTLIAPILDEAINQLGEADRTAVLLRFFEQRDFRSVGEALGGNEDAARMRVTRALEKLHSLLKHRGVTTSAAALGVALSASSVQAAPAGLAASISSAAILAGTTVAATTAVTITKAIAMTTLQKAIIGTTLAVAIGTGIYETRQNSALREENKSLQQQVAKIQSENESLSNRLTASGETQSLSAGDEQFNELIRLRGEVETLHRQNAEFGKRLADVNNPKSQDPNPPEQSAITAPLPADYPKTPDSAAQTIFETWGKGDWDSFFTNFEVDGGREFWDQAVNDEMKSNLVNMEVVSIGEPTNSFAPNMWFVPYVIKFQDGTAKSARLHVAQDPKTKRWILKGGF